MTRRENKGITASTKERFYFFIFAMSPIIKHILLPIVSPALFFLVVANPGNVLTCRMRGLLALIIAFISLLAAVGAAIMAMKSRTSGNTDNVKLWIATSLVLALPAVALIRLA